MNEQDKAEYIAQVADMSSRELEEEYAEVCKSMAVSPDNSYLQDMIGILEDRLYGGA